MIDNFNHRPGGEKLQPSTPAPRSFRNCSILQLDRLSGEVTIGFEELNCPCELTLPLATVAAADQDRLAEGLCLRMFWEPQERGPQPVFMDGLSGVPCVARLEFIDAPATPET